MFCKLISQIKTVTERDRLVSELNLLKEAFYKKNAKDEVARILENTIRSEAAEEIRAIFDKESKDQAVIIDELLEMLSKLQAVKLTLAIEPTGEIMEAICNFLAKNVTSNVLIDLSINPAIIGGAIVSFEGEYGDYSLQKRLDS